MKETEITVQIFETLENVIKKLDNFGYKEVEVFTGQDAYFTTLSNDDVAEAGYGKLLSNSLIVRSFMKKTDGKRDSMLVFKNKTLDEKGNVISEEKISTRVDDKEVCKRALSFAGLNNWTTLSQENHFMKKGEITIIVGKVEGLEGVFMEIEEYDSIKSLTPKEKIDILKKLANSFGFNLGDDYSVKKVYMLFQKNYSAENQNV